jgi:hypothetical protein
MNVNLTHSDPGSEGSSLLLCGWEEGPLNERSAL